MSHPTVFFYPRPRVDVAEVPAASHAGAVLLTDTIHATGLGLAHATSLSPVRVTGVRPTGTESVHAGLQPRALSRL